MINPKYKNVFFAPGGGRFDDPADESEEETASTPIVLNGHTIASKLRGKTGASGQTIGTVIGNDKSPKILMVHFEDGDDPGTATCDKTTEEIMAVYNADGLVFGKYMGYTLMMVYDCIFAATVIGGQAWSSPDPYTAIVITVDSKDSTIWNVVIEET